MCGNSVLKLNINSGKTISSIYEFSPDIVSFHGLYYIEYLFIAIALRRHRIPYVIQFHGGASRDNYQKHKLKKWIANTFIFNRFVKNAESTVYLNEGELDKSIFKRFNTPYFIIPNGIEIKESITLNEHSYINILFFSRIDIYGKGLDVLAEVIKKLSLNPLAGSIRFVFYGHIYNNSRDYFKQFNNNVEYRGTVYGKDKDNAFLESDVVILPSRSEGMPLTVLEAFSYGRPVIVTPETNMGEIVTQNNLGWVTKLTVEDLYSVILRAVDDIGKDSLGYMDRCLRFSKQFSWDSIAKDSIKKYGLVIQRFHSINTVD